MSTGCSKGSMCGFTCLRCRFGVRWPHCAAKTTFSRAQMPPASTWLPMALLIAPNVSRSFTASLRWARQAAFASMASARKAPEPWHSMPSTSACETAALRTAWAMTSCSAAAFGALKEADCPLLLIMPPAMVPRNLSASSRATTLPSTISVLLLMITEPQPSPRAKPLAEELKVMQRPSGDIQPLWHHVGHHTADRQRDAEIARAISLLTVVPFLRTESAAWYTAVRPDAASVVKDRDGPFMPRQKEIRPDIIQRLPETPPPTAYMNSWFVQPT
mmetsp:Transcript_117616/g.163815  ORF Transcript_117616/g.163815 Transcript_117616/m.163815 type:complete len:274 (+) Transcript_117616:1295-2116(+)